MRPLRLFFDECCSSRLPIKLKELYAEDFPDLETIHLSDVLQRGTDDSEWIETLGGDSGWIVVTKDRGKDPKKSKLPILCRKLSVTHISMTPTLADAGYVHYKQAILSVWPQILKVRFVPKGTKVSLGYRSYLKGLVQSPCLTIEGKPFEIWCQANGVDLSN